MSTISAINTLASLMQLAMNSMAAASQVSAIIQKAHSEGRGTLTADEMAAIKGADDVARAALVSAINGATP